MNGRVALDFAERRADVVEDAAIVADEIHLVHGENEVGDAEQLGDASVTPCLLADAVPGVHQQDGEVGG